MYPVGLERFYGGLKLAISEGGLPVLEEQTRGESIRHEGVPFLQLFSTKELCEKHWEETQQMLLSVSRMNIQMHMLAAEMPELFKLPSRMSGSGQEGGNPARNLG